MLIESYKNDRDFLNLLQSIHLKICFLLCVNREIRLPDNYSECHVFILGLHNSNSSIYVFKNSRLNFLFLEHS